ncbi:MULTISPECIES: CAP domain-containing protein [Niastella]|uniref:CAP domain-containing protein n=1 Tax=Niastella soli TaxID=2821487 RepID=A0ABS3Z4J7_9BACT|nr:CAP domain-containing protein [Niastella soli]MBO9204958.1 CAP domain-containing protein [Niastella soli]
MIKLFRLAIIIVFLPACHKDTNVVRTVKEEMLAAVNALRQTGCTCGNTFMPPVKPLQWNDTLAKAAQAHARDMDANNYFSHISPGGTSPIQRTMALGYAGNYVTENIARGYAELGPVMTAWEISEDHCKAMMDSLQTELGAGNINTYWVQEFGSRR